jgi:ABC-type transport system involved in multi-copper enzyme maturation permease subunit
VPIPRRNAVEFFQDLIAEASDPEILQQRIAELRGEAPSSNTSDPDVEQEKETVWGIAIGVLVAGVITLLGLLLWATPIVQAELEGRTWIYLAVRPRGRASVLLGKYLTAVIWTTLAGWTSATICVGIAQPPNGFLLWRSLLFVIVLGCLGYGALFSLIGVLIPRRAMVIAVAYTLIFEFLVSFIPAVINQFTVHYRLRNLLVQFMGWRDLLPDGTGEVLLGDQPAWLHIGILGLTVVVLLTVAMQAIQVKEYVSAEEA